MSDTPLADALKDQYCFSHLSWYKLCGELERENAALRADKERLDWLESLHFLWEGTEKTGPVFLTRDAIDAARKEAQP